MKFKSIPAVLATSATLATLAVAGLLAIQGAVAQAAPSHARAQTTAVAARTHVSASPAATATTTVVRTHKTALGNVLAGPKGNTLYLFKADKRNKSNCNMGCQGIWPELLLKGKLEAAGGVKANLLGSIPRPGGGRQVTYNGHPLYYYSPDTHPGQLLGEGSLTFGAEWDVLSIAGNAVVDNG